jgi:hypothetical protein
MGTKGFWWIIVRNRRNLIGIFLELDENKRILMGYWWEQEEFDGNCVGTWWEIQSPPLQKDKKQPLGACLHHPIGSPIVVTYEIHVFFEGAQKEIFSSILKFENVNTWN